MEIILITIIPAITHMATIRITIRVLHRRLLSVIARRHHRCTASRPTVPLKAHPADTPHILIHLNMACLNHQQMKLLL
jgi:hypothetical protein